jgi:hypothetical protein
LLLRPHSLWSVSPSGFEDDYSTRSCSCPFSLVTLPGRRPQASRSRFLAANPYHQHRRVGRCLSVDVKSSRMDGLPSALSETQLPSNLITPFSHGFSTSIHFRTFTHFLSHCFLDSAEPIYSVRKFATAFQPTIVTAQSANFRPRTVS